MKYFKVDLYDYFKIDRPEGANGYLTIYAHEKLNYYVNRTRPAMLVVAGGGYTHLSMAEREPVTMKYYAEGFQCFVLEYSFYPIGYPYQALEGVMAMLYIKENSKELLVTPNKIAAIGFSAGGNLIGTLATMCGDKKIVDIIGERAKTAKPDALIFAYGLVICYDHEYAFSEEYISPLCPDINDRDKVNVYKNITKDTPPAFIWHCGEDNCVPPEQSLILGLAYRKAGVPCELHLYREGKHGLTLGTIETADRPHQVLDSMTTWMGLSLTFLKNLGFKIENNE